MSALADEFGQQGGVVAAAPVLADAHAGLDLGRFEHGGLQMRGGDGTERQAVVIALDDRRVVRGVGGLQRLTRREQVSRHGGEGRRHRFGPDRSLLTKLARHGAPESVGVLDAIDGGHIGHG